jgi:hypothetical protein
MASATQLPDHMEVREGSAVHDAFSLGMQLITSQGAFQLME